jgi:hypothetical protein
LPQLIARVAVLTWNGKGCGEWALLPFTARRGCYSSKRRAFAPSARGVERGRVYTFDHGALPCRSQQKILSTDKIINSTNYSLYNADNFVLSSFCQTHRRTQ